MKNLFNAKAVAEMHNAEINKFKEAKGLKEKFKAATGFTDRDLKIIGAGTSFGAGCGARWGFENAWHGETWDDYVDAEKSCGFDVVGEYTDEEKEAKLKRANMTNKVCNTAYYGAAGAGVGFCITTAAIASVCSEERDAEFEAAWNADREERKAAKKAKKEAEAAVRAEAEAKLKETQK